MEPTRLSSSSPVEDILNSLLLWKAAGPSWAFLGHGTLADPLRLRVTLLLSESPLFKPLLNKCHHCEFAWNLRMRKKPSPSGGREGESYSHLKCWSQGNALVLSEDACCLTHYGKWGQGPGAVWQGALLVTTANSSGLWWLPLGWPLALLIISGASLLLSNLFHICILRIVICSLAVLSKLGDLSNKHLLLPALEAESPRSRCQPIWFLVRTLLLVYRETSSYCVLTWQRERGGSGIAIL